MPSHINQPIVAERFEFVTNPDVAVWEDIVRLTTEHEGWAMSVHDYPVWLGVFGPHNFSLLVAVDKDSKKVVGSVSSSTYPSVNGSKRLTTIGMFFVHPEYRGLGIGTTLFDRLLSDPNVMENNKALTSASNMAQKYASVFGFDKFTYWNLLTRTAKIEDMELGRLTFPAGINLVDPESVGWSKILEYNSKFAGGINRDAYMKAWMRSPAAHAK
ncbi:Protein T24A6.20, partial [Aphelenchoides avenae]